MLKLLSRFKNKKAFTLAELCVVLALLAIVSTTVVTMSTLIQKRVTRSVNNDKVVDDLTSIELATKNWLTHFDNADYAIEILTLEDGNTALVAKKEGTEVSRLAFDSVNHLYESNLSTNKLSNAMQRIEFQQRTSKTSYRLIECYVYYVLPQSGEQDYSPLMFTLRSGKK